jgi:cytochrome c553
MHTIGAAWVSGHEGYAQGGGATGCAYCHGSDYRGTALSQVKAPRTYTIEGRTRTYAAGDKVGCYDCHSGPNP